jgi:hypothetical protein
MTEFDEIARINAKGTTILGGLTASIREGVLTPAPGGGFNVAPTPNPVPIGPDGRPLDNLPAVPCHVLIGNSLLASFEPGEKAEAQALVEDINDALDPLRKKLKTRFLADLRKAIGK